MKVGRKMNTQSYYSGSTQRFHGLSTDTKPSGCQNGSVFFEMDTNFVYLYDADGDSWHKIEDNIDYDSVTNKPTINGVEISGNKSLSDIGAASDEDIEQTNVVLATLINGGQKSVANATGNNETINGVTFTNNGNGTWSTSGTASGRAPKVLDFRLGQSIPAGKYILTGCPAGGKTSGGTIKYALYLWDKTINARVTPNNDDTGSGFQFDWTPDESHLYCIIIDIRSGTNANGLTFKPMICSMAAYNLDNKFVPYVPSNKELFEMIVQLQAQVQA